MIAIIDYNSGNLISVANALKKLGQTYLITNDPQEIQKADKVIFPGVGQANTAMEELKKLKLIPIIKSLTVPFLGICIGMQLLAEFSEEGETQCLGIIPGQVKKFPPTEKVPQIGWNQVEFSKKIPLFQNIPLSPAQTGALINQTVFQSLEKHLNSSFFYFVNSYYLPSVSPYTTSIGNYSESFAATVQKDNFYGTQFHPEKSGETGLKVLSNFCSL